MINPGDLVAELFASAEREVIIRSRHSSALPRLPGCWKLYRKG